MPREVCSFWIGPKPLHYLNHVCLASYVNAGHNVTLYTTTEWVDKLVVPEGVKILSADDVYDGISKKLTGRVPATAADLFRIILIKERGVIWIDTDVYCIKPFPDEQKYIFATEAPEKLQSSNHGNINNAVLALPKDSQALELLSQFSFKTLGLVEEVDPRVQEYIESGVGHAILKYGPRAVTHFLGLTDELKHQLEPSTLYPVHFNLCDCMFDPLVNLEARFDNETLALHLWGSQIRNGWYRRRALKGSFIWKAAKKMNINMNKYLRQK